MCIATRPSTASTRLPARPSGGPLDDPGLAVALYVTCVIDQLGLAFGATADALRRRSPRSDEGERLIEE